MNQYRLKKEAVQFFNEKYATAIKDFHFWENIGVDNIALEVVEDAYVSFGHKTGENTTSLSGWNKENGTTFLFTIHFPSTKYYEHDQFTNGKMSRELMDRIQRQVNSFYADFSNAE